MSCLVGSVLAVVFSSFYLGSISDAVDILVGVFKRWWIAGAASAHAALLVVATAGVHVWCGGSRSIP